MIPALDPHRTAPIRVAFRTIGCKLNQCDTAQMQESLSASGYRLVDWSQAADVRVINTCTVTAKSDRTCRHEIRAAKRSDPGCVLAVTGCYAQVDPEALASIPGVDLVLGNIEKSKLADHLRDHLAGESPKSTGDAVASMATTCVTSYSDGFGFEAEFFTHFYGYTRAFLKIQTGCDSVCSYCIIPQARGPARSMPKADVLEQVRRLAACGYQEVVLTGIDLGSWAGTDESSLADLLALLVEQGGVSRYRLSSIEPMELGDDLLDVIDRAGATVARHLHLPLQSGCDSVLRRMGRPYDAAEYLDVIANVARRFPEAALGTDVIVGFPGESDQDFEQTYQFIEHAPLTYLHVFSYSDRPGTPAALMGPKVCPETIHARSMRLRQLGQRKNARSRSKLAGTLQRALVLNERTPEGLLVGLTGNYQEVLVETDDAPTNEFVWVRLDRSLPDGRWQVATMREGRDVPSEVSAR